MKKATAVILVGLILLFFGSLYAGQKIFSESERRLALTDRLSQANAPSPEAAAAARERAEFRKVRLAMSSFDLANGLTPRDLEVISTSGRSFAFYFLMASIWLALALRRPKRGESP